MNLASVRMGCGMPRYETGFQSDITGMLFICRESQHILLSNCLLVNSDHNSCTCTICVHNNKERRLFSIDPISDELHVGGRRLSDLAHDNWPNIMYALPLPRMLRIYQFFGSIRYLEVTAVECMLEFKDRVLAANTTGLLRERILSQSVR